MPDMRYALPQPSRGVAARARKQQCSRGFFRRARPRNKKSGSPLSPHLHVCHSGNVAACPQALGDNRLQGVLLLCVVLGWSSGGAQAVVQQQGVRMQNFPPLPQPTYSPAPAAAYLKRWDPTSEFSCASPAAECRAPPLKSRRSHSQAMARGRATTPAFRCRPF